MLHEAFSSSCFPSYSDFSQIYVLFSRDSALTSFAGSFAPLLLLAVDSCCQKAWCWFLSCFSAHFNLSSICVLCYCIALIPSKETEISFVGKFQASLPFQTSLFTSCSQIQINLLKVMRLDCDITRYLQKGNNFLDMYAFKYIHVLTGKGVGITFLIWLEPPGYWRHKFTMLRWQRGVKEAS